MLIAVTFWVENLCRADVGGALEVAVRDGAGVEGGRA